MKTENREYLEANEHYWTTLRDAGYMKGLDGNTRSAFVRIITEEFQPGYATDLWCPPCVADMIKLVYRYFNEWREKQKAEPDPLHARKAQLLMDHLRRNEGAIIPMLDFGFHNQQASTAEEDFSEPLPEPQTVVKKANFPKHHKRRR